MVWGGCKETDVICTIDSGVSMWHTLIMEKYVETNQLTQREREIPIKTANRKGYIMARNYDSIDISSRMVYHRGTVQHGIAHTIKTEIDVGVIEIG